VTATRPGPSGDGASSWDEVRPALGLDEADVARHRGRFEADLREHRLAEIRRRRRVTQQELAGALGVSQSRISQIERQGPDGTVLSTLAAYIAALDGSLRLVADFGDERLELALSPAADPAATPVSPTASGPEPRST
jgi:DNA-binding XRE family transcriptional regulator